MICEEAFSGCAELTSISIPDSVTVIGNYAFGNGLTSITIPRSLTDLSSLAFYRCESLTSISVDASNPNYSSEDGVLFNKDKTTLIRYPQRKTGTYVIQSGVLNICDSAFKGCKSLTDITIPDSVTVIGHNAFYGCESLTSVTIPNGVTTIEEDTFEGCTSLINVTMPNSITEIGFCAFAGCASLESVTIPSNVTSISSQVFSGCKSLVSAIYKDKMYSVFIEKYYCDLPREFYDAVNGR